MLAVILVPAISTVRAKAHQTGCASNLRQIGAAFHLYLADNNGLYPEFTGGSMYNWGGKRTNWGGAKSEDRPLYPYIGSVEVFRCPADNSSHFNRNSSFFDVAGNSYSVANSGQRGILRREGDASRRAVPGDHNLIEQPSRTILAFDNTLRNGESGYKSNSPVYWHPGDVSNVLMTDGHVAVFTRQIAETYINPVNPPGYSWGWSVWNNGDQW